MSRARLASVAGFWLFCAVGIAAEPPSPDPALEALLADVDVAPHLEQALRLRDEGAVDETLDSLRKANAAVKKKRGSSHPDQLPVLDLAAETLIGAGRYAEAITPLERAVAIRETVESADHPPGLDVALASSLLLLGKACAQAGRQDRAVEALRKSSTLFTTALGEDHEATIMARKELAAAAGGAG